MSDTGGGPAGPGGVDARSASWAAPARVLAFGAGAAAAVALWLGSVTWGEVSPEPGVPHFWVADRDGRHLVGLDRELFVSRSAFLSRPVDLAVGEDGDLWCLLARGDGPDGPHGLLCVGTGVEVPLEGRPLGLAASGGQASVLLDGPRGVEVWRVAPHGVAHRLARVREGTCLAARGAQVLVGDSRGRVSLLGSYGVRSARPGDEIRAVAAGAGSSWWVLTAGPDARLVHLAADLSTRRVLETGLEDPSMAVVPDADSVWLVGGRERRALRIAADGHEERALGDLPMAGLVAGAATRSGGLLLLAPGAVLHIDSAGRMARGQGGFGFLVDGVLARP